jgi:hypothetical protein
MPVDLSEVKNRIFLDEKVNIILLESLKII